MARNFFTTVWADTVSAGAYPNKAILTSSITSCSSHAPVSTSARILVSGPFLPLVGTPNGSFFTPDHFTNRPRCLFYRSPQAEREDQRCSHSNQLDCPEKRHFLKGRYKSYLGYDFHWSAPFSSGFCCCLKSLQSLA